MSEAKSELDALSLQFGRARSGGPSSPIYSSNESPPISFFNSSSSNPHSHGNVNDSMDKFRKQPDNQFCADCLSPSPEWASLSLPWCGSAHTMTGHGPCMMNFGFTRSKINCHYFELAGNCLKIPFTGQLLPFMNVC